MAWRTESEALARLLSIEEGMGRVKGLAEAGRWEDAQELLHGQEREGRQFVLWLEGLGRKGLLEADGSVRRCRQVLEGLAVLVAELESGFGRRRDELLEALGGLKEQERATRKYEGPSPKVFGLSGKAPSPPESGGKDFSPSGHAGRWSPRRLALYR